MSVLTDLTDVPPHECACALMSVGLSEVLGEQLAITAFPHRELEEFLVLGKLVGCYA